MNIRRTCFFIISLLLVVSVLGRAVLHRPHYRIVKILAEISAPANDEFSEQAHDSDEEDRLPTLRKRLRDEVRPLYVGISSSSFHLHRPSQVGKLALVLNQPLRSSIRRPLEKPPRLSRFFV